MQYVIMAASRLKKQHTNSMAPLIDSTGIMGIMGCFSNSLVSILELSHCVKLYVLHKNPSMRFACRFDRAAKKFPSALGALPNAEGWFYGNVNAQTRPKPAPDERSARISFHRRRSKRRHW